MHTIRNLTTLKRVWLDEIRYVPPWHEGYFLSFTSQFYNIMLSCLNLRPRYYTWTKTLNVLSQYLLHYQQVHAVPRTKFRVSFMMLQFYSPSLYLLILLFFIGFPFSSFSRPKDLFSLFPFSFSPSTIHYSSLSLLIFLLPTFLFSYVYEFFFLVSTRYLSIHT